jgi:hypothetical protein
MSENVMITPLFHQRSHSMPVGRTFIKSVNMLPLYFGKKINFFTCSCSGNPILSNGNGGGGNGGIIVENNRTFDFKRYC